MSSSCGESSRVGSFMDERLWSGLQNYIDLSIIYAKLPNDAFFRLRAVCKEWNRLASEPSFLKESCHIPTLHFLVDGPMTCYRLLTYESSSRRWNWTHGLPRADSAVAGLLCTQVYDFAKPTTYKVFNVHTRTVHTLPSPPEVDYAALFDAIEDAMPDEPLIGMTVDTSRNPHSYRVILGHKDVGTRIYDSESGSWSTELPSKSDFWVYGQDSLFAHSDPTGVEFGGTLYIRLWGMYGDFVNLFTYDLEYDGWDVSYVDTSLPTWSMTDGVERDIATYDIGAYKDRFFIFGIKYLDVDFEPFSKIMAWSCSSPSSKKATWTLFDLMPDDLCAWMQAGFKVLGFTKLEIKFKFCGEHVLIYKCENLKDVAERAILYNLESKTWQKVGIPGDDFSDDSSKSVTARRNL